MYNKIKTYYLQLIPNIKEEEWAFIEANHEVLHLKKGEFLLKAGQHCNHVAFINKGIIRMFNIQQNKENTFGLIPDNQYVSNYASFLTRSTSEFYIEALEDCELFLLNYEAMQKGYDLYPIFERAGRKIIEILFIEFSNRIVSLLTESPEDRYLKVMELEAYVLEKIPQYIVASYLGITPEHLSRIRRKISKKKLPK